MFFNRNKQCLLERPWTKPLGDIYETDKEIIVELEMPGVEKKDVSIELQQDQLIIKGIKKKEVGEDKQNPIYHERHNEIEYQRVFCLFSNINQETVQAQLRDGVLQIVLVKTIYSQKKKIEILSQE